jgi:hypothetical protein
MLLFFSEWSVEAYGEMTDFSTISSEDLDKTNVKIQCRSHTKNSEKEM